MESKYYELEIEINKHYCNSVPEVKALIDTAGFELVATVDKVLCCLLSETEYEKIEMVEKALVELGVPFDRYRYEHSSWKALKRIYRPATEGFGSVDSEFDLSTDGEERIDCHKLVKVLWSDATDTEMIRILKSMLRAVSPEAKRIEDCVVVISG